MEQKIIVTAERDIMDLMETYMRNRRRDVQLLAEALAASDFGTLKRLGHQLLGSAMSYGHPYLVPIGRAIEQGAIARDVGRIQEATEQLRSYLERVEVHFL